MGSVEDWSARDDDRRPSRTDGQAFSDPTSVVVRNLDDELHTVSLTVGTGDETVLERTIELDAASGLSSRTDRKTLSDVVAGEGPHGIEVELEDGTSETHRWSSVTRYPRIVVTITAAGEIRIGPRRDSTDGLRYVVSDFEVARATYDFLLRRTGSAGDVALADGESFVDAEELPGPVRETIIEALHDRERERVVDDLPDGLASVLDEHDYVTYEGWYYRISLLRINRDDSVRLGFDATLTDDRIAPDEPARIELVVTNDGTEEAVIHDGAFPPFGVLRGVGNTSGVPILLWSDGYVDSPYLVDSEYTLELVRKIPGESVLEPGETIETTYQLRLETTGPLDPDTYAVDSNLTFSDTSESGRKRRDARLDYCVSFTVDSDPSAE